MAAEDSDDDGNIIGNQASSSSGYSEKEVREVLYPLDNFMIMLEAQAGRQSKHRDPKADLAEIDLPDQELPPIL